jgi:hypothetical protein
MTKDNDKWEIEDVDRYYYFCGRNNMEYVETTFWYNPKTMERKESKRTVYIYDGEQYKLPDWAKRITTRRRSLESDRVY